mgnify:CR=1 FL=1
MAEHNEIGKIGENMAKTFLMKQGFSILDLNYRVLQGEIDIIAKKDKIIHFVEVKTVKVRDVRELANLDVTPEDNLTFAKWSKLKIAIESYLLHKNVSDETLYQADLACVYLDTEKKEGRVRLMQNIIRE